MDWVNGNKVTRAVDAAASRADGFLARRGDRYLERVWERTRARALAADPLYAEIEVMRKKDPLGIVMYDPNNPRLGWDAWEYQNSVESVFLRHTAVLKIARWASNRPLGRAVNDFIARRQRAQRGWDFKATYSLDHHLASTLGPQLLEVAEAKSEENATWLAEMRAAGTAIAHYAKKDDFVLGEEVSAQEMLTIEADLTVKAQEALHWVASNLTRLSR